MKVLKTTKEITALVNKLKDCPKISRFDDESESEGERIAHSFHDMQKSFTKISDTLLPELIHEEDNDSINKILLEIGEELRHIQYHIRDMKFYDYLE